MAVKSAAMAYGATSCGAAAIHNIFILYYVQLFLEVYKVSDGWFYFGEVLFMLWNSFNDPYFGYLIEKQRTKGGLNKLPLIKWGGLAWSLVFVFVFVPLFPNDPSALGLHFVVALFLYDAALSLVMLAHSSLLADLVVDSNERATLNKFGSMGGVVGSCSVLLSHFFWDRTDVRSFQVFCFVVGLFSCFAFFYTSSSLEPLIRSRLAHSLKTSGSLKEEADEGHEDEGEIRRKRKTKTEAEGLGLWSFIGQLMGHKNFWIFTTINLVQVVNCHFNSNFMGIFIDRFVRDSFPFPLLHSSAMCFAAISPHLLVVFLTPYIHSYGLHKVMNGLFVVKVVMGAVFYALSTPVSWIMIFSYIVLNKIFSEAICRHGNLVVADLVDEDCALNRRRDPISSMIFGANAFVTKPGQSIAPIIGWMVLRRYEYSEAIEKQQVDGDLRAVMFTMLFFVPIACGALQIFLWSLYSLKGSYLSQIKAHRQEDSSKTVV